MRGGCLTRARGVSRQGMNTPHGTGKPAANRDPGRLRRRTDIALPTGGEWWIKHGSRGRPASFNHSGLTPRAIASSTMALLLGLSRCSSLFIPCCDKPTLSANWAWLIPSLSLASLTRFPSAISTSLQVTEAYHVCFSPDNNSSSCKKRLLVLLYGYETNGV